MSLFSEILCKQFPAVKIPSINFNDINFLLDSYKYNDNYHITIQFLYNIDFILYNNSNQTNKFNILNNVILNNKNLSNEEVNYFLIKFYLAQKTYNSLRKFANSYKFKTAQKFEIENDLCFTLFSDLSPNITYNNS